MVWTFTKVNVQSMRKSAQIFVCFSESPNFKKIHGAEDACKLHKLTNLGSEPQCKLDSGFSIQFQEK